MDGNAIWDSFIALLIIVAIFSAILGWCLIEGILWLIHHVSIIIN